MRFKPPPSIDSKIGWRVEFRTMDIQVTDFENSALLVVISMLYNILNHFDVNFMMHISKIDENMERAHKKDAYFKEKFWFRTNILPTGKCYKWNIMDKTDFTQSNNFANGEDPSNPYGCCFNDEESYHELYIYEILEGKPEINYKGIYPLINEYMAKRQYNKEDVEQANMYMQFILERAKGEVQTGAHYIRNFVLNHPEYKKDSIVSPAIAFDLLSNIVNMNSSVEDRAQLLGKKWLIQ